MKSILFTLVFAFIAFGAFSQKMADQLQSKKWFVTGDLNRAASLKLTPTTPKAGADWEAQFSSTGSMYNCNTLKANTVDASGIEVKAGTYYCDSLSNLYKVNNDVIKITTQNGDKFYKMMVLPNSEGIEFVPASANDFK